MAGVLGLGRAQVWWREARAYSASPWERYGWAGLAAANFALASLLPAGWVWAWSRCRSRWRRWPGR